MDQREGGPMKPTDFRQIIAGAVADAKTISDEIDVLARILAEKMHSLHGDRGGGIIPDRNI
jgi:hypothetical protein